MLHDEIRRKKNINLKKIKVKILIKRMRIKYVKKKN
jgi:hypothetical protein